MKYIYILLIVSFFSNYISAQSDNCSGAVALTIGSCVTGNPGATQNLPGCSGDANDDAWYKFTAVAGTSYSITVAGSSNYDAVFQIYSGASCGSLVALTSPTNCIDSKGYGGKESIVTPTLTAGTYYIRIYDYWSTTAPGTFTTCISIAPPVPGNDECVNAKVLAVNASCVNTSTTSYAATQSSNVTTNCNNGTPDDDVWFMFTATNYTQTIKVTPTGSMLMDPVIEAFSGACNSMTVLACEDITYSGQAETMSLNGLIPGDVYYIRVYDWFSRDGQPFNICVSGTPIVTGTQPNDEPCGAIRLPDVTSDCSILDFSNENATLTSSALAPDPTGCSGGTGGFIATSQDVWFTIKVPANGNICITPRPNMGAGWITDGVMALYTGSSCSALTLHSCSDDADGTSGIYNYPGTANDFLPYINATGLTPGSIVYLRYWGWQNEVGDFGLCVTSPTNDNCSNALYICDLNGYSAATNAAYTADWPSNMKGDAETTWNPGPPAKYNFAPGPTASGGIFGLGGTWGVGQPYTVNAPCVPYQYDVQIDNNSWIRFKAASTSASFSVTIGDCWLGGCKAGIQMQIFSAVSACTTFTPVSDYRQSATSFSLTANNLVVGQDYYLMVDGWGGDICNYTINALSGVVFSNITANPAAVCPGQSSILTAPSGATSYEWYPGGQTTQTISVIPDKSVTSYTCFVSGVCGNKQMLTKDVTWKAVPSITIAASNSVICNGQSTTLTGSGANTYTWSGGITNGSAFSPTATTAYTVTGTNSTTSCTNIAISTVTVNALPSVTATASSSVICNGASTTLSGSGTATTYTWTGGVTNGVAFSPTTTLTYTVTGTDGNGCSTKALSTVTVNPKPTVGSTTTGSVICSGNSVTLSGTGADTYTWTGGSVTDGVAFTPTATATYTVIGTLAATGCTNTSVRTVTVNTTPTVSITATNSAICLGGSTSLSGAGASSYTWSGSVSNGVAFSPTTTASYTVTGATLGCTNTAVRTITVNALPTITANATSTAICNGSSVTLTGSGSATTYTWSGSVSNGVAFTPTVTNTYTVTGTDGNGCVNTAVKTITVNSIPTSTASTSGTITCVTNTVNLNSTLAGQSYTWTAPGGSSISSGTNSQNAIGQGSGTYTLYVSSAAGCTYSTTLATNINTTTPTASATGGTLTCAQTSTVLVGGPASGVTYSWSGPGISGSTTSANATATTVGTYSLITTFTSNGCPSTSAAIATVTNNLTTPTVTAGSNQTITCAAPTVTLTGGATGGSNLSWSSGATTSSTTVGGSGIYTLTATNPGTGCSAISTVQVFPSAGTPTANISSVTNSITCANTTVSVSITSGSSPISILWTGPGIIGSTTTPSTTVSQGGTYTVTITNTISLCSQAYPVVVPTNTTPVVAIASVAASASITCNTPSLTLSSSPTGANYSYSWTGPGIVSGGNTANPVINMGGNYSVTITNTITGCSGVTGTTNVAVPSNTTIPSLNVSATSVTTTCSNPGTIVTASSNANPNTTYTWTAPATGTISSTSISNPSIGGSGVFTVAVTNTLSGCVSAIGTVTITADSNIPTFNLGATTATITCAIPSPSVSLTSTVSNVTYSWSPTPASGVGTASPTFTATGNYTCVITNTVNNCSTSLAQVSVGLDQTAPTATATPASSITCNSASVAISSTVTPASNVNYSWSGPNVISGNTTLSPTIGLGGDYLVTMTNTVNGCTGTYTVNVPTNTTVPTMSLSTNAYTTTCSSPSVILVATSDADPNTTYSWTAPVTGTISSTNINNPSVGGSGVFTVTATNTVSGCVSAIGTVSVTADANTPTFTLSANTATITCAIPSPSVVLTSTVSNVSYSWSPTPASGITTASPTFTAPGNYTCVITNTINNCNTNLPQVAVSVNTVVPTVSISPNSSITCSLTTVVITSTVVPGNSTYTWSGIGIVGSSNGSSITVNTAGTYSLATTDPANGCINNTAVVTVVTNTVAPTLSVTATSSILTCSITGSTLTATPNTSTWTTPTGGSTSNPLIVTAVGDYTATVVDPVNGCSTFTTITITNNVTPPNANAGAATVMPCASPTVTLLGTSTTTDAVSYSWAGPGSIINGNSSSPTVGSVGVYTLTVTDVATGCTATSTVDVSQTNVTAAFTADPMIGEIPLTVNFTNGSIGATTYNWNFNNGSTSTTQDPSTVYTTEGTYTVTLIASAGLCSDTAVKIIVAEDGFTIEIPNVFTPNGDGANDLFHIKTTGVKSAEGYIYNRWGQLLYSWDALKASWDGIASNGEKCPDANYYYLIKVIDKKDKEHIAPGYVLIIR